MLVFVLVLGAVTVALTPPVVSITISASKPGSSVPIISPAALAIPSPALPIKPSIQVTLLMPPTTVVRMSSAFFAAPLKTVSTASLGTQIWLTGSNSNPLAAQVA